MLKNTRMDSHKDLSVVTLLLQDSLGGLEVFDRQEKQFVAAPVRDDALLVHAGEFLERFSRGRISATPHRVRTIAGAGARCSVVFFAFPNFSSRIVPIGGESDESFVAGDLHPRL